MDERTGEICKLFHQRSGEFIQLANISIKRTVNIAEFCVVIGYLLIAFVVCNSDLEKFLVFSTYASSIFLVTCLFVVISSNTIENPFLFFFSLAYFVSIFALHVIPRLYGNLLIYFNISKISMAIILFLLLISYNHFKGLRPQKIID